MTTSKIAHLKLFRPLQYTPNSLFQNTRKFGCFKDLRTVGLDLKYHFWCKRKSLSKILSVAFKLSNVFLQLEDNFTCYLLITLLSFHSFLPLQLIDSVLNSHFSTDKTCLSRSSASSYQIPEQATAHPPLGLSQAPQLQYITIPNVHWPPPRCSSLSFL